MNLLDQTLKNESRIKKAYQSPILAVYGTLSQLTTATAAGPKSDGKAVFGMQKS